jgi:hypothetical protein
MQASSEYQTASGLAALSICESLLVSLRDLKIMGEKEVVGLLKDASAAHRNAVASAQDPKTHHAAADVIDRIIAGKNSVRHAADEGVADERLALIGPTAEWADGRRGNETSMTIGEYVQSAVMRFSQYFAVISTAADAEVMQTRSSRTRTMPMGGDQSFNRMAERRPQPE